MGSNLRTREQIESKYKWKLNDIIPSREEWDNLFEEVEHSVDDMARYKGTLDKYENTKEMLYRNDELSLKLEKLFVYARMNRDTDNANADYNAMVGKVTNLIVRYDEITSYIQPELSEIDNNTLLEWADKEEMYPFDFLLREVSRNKPHVLSKAEERLLALAGEMGGSYDDIFTMLSDVDMKFAPVTKDGHQEEMSHGRYGLFMEDTDRDVRRQAFKSMYGAYGAQINTVAALYGASVKKDVFFAKARNFNTVREGELFGGNIPVDVYDSLISAVHDALPDLHEYVTLRKNVLGLSDMQMYDMYVPMFPAKQSSVPFEKGYKMVLKALEPLGENYQKVLAGAFDEGWIDVYETAGKTSGAYSWGAYGTHPYIMLNYQGRLDDAFTLAHEAGHAMHSYHSDEALPYSKAGYRIFVAEVASTVNEVLFLRHLLDNTDDVDMKKYLLELHLEQFRTTVFRQTMFAEFELAAHTQAESGETPTKDWLCRTYGDLNRTYYGNDVETGEDIAMEWARIPHFYRPFYVYQYATGFCAAVAIANRILSYGKPAVEDYLAFLSSGGSGYPIDLLKIAGVDMSKPETVKAGLKTFKDTLDALKKLL